MNGGTSAFQAAGAFSIGHQAQTSLGDLSGRHYHDCYEIYYLDAGERRYFIRDTVYHVQPGSLALIDMYCIHKTIEVKGKLNAERTLVKFKPAFFGGFLSVLDQANLFAPFRTGKPVLRLDGENSQFVAFVLRRMIEEYEERPAGYADSVRCLLATLLLHLARGLGPSPVSPAGSSDPLHAKMLSVVSYINQAYSDDLTLDSLAPRFSISRYYLCRSFKKVIGIGVVEYLNNIRIRNAQRLLRETALPIHRIANEVGFRTTTHFERVFKALNGTSPLKFRKRGRGRQHLAEASGLL